MAATGAGGTPPRPLTDRHSVPVKSKGGGNEESQLDDINLGEPSSSTVRAGSSLETIAAANGHTGKASSAFALLFTQFARFDIEITVLLLALLFICTVSAIFTRVSCS